MAAVLLVLLLAAVLFGLGFLVKALWWVAFFVFVGWLIGFIVRPVGRARGRGHWYRW
ncbi:hydrophobic protein [Kitasatospora viridis]|uniref:Hydrophobic protein n=1 Tax=Kitasatospora viridis TaxID=281105 RepID=A0A561SEF8_9ACTN|nr:hydrophobic protein [Kitasatospora viridis]TWF73253.1 hypothetical protein FHX73_16404 [Kitasatospora viridis]